MSNTIHKSSQFHIIYNSKYHNILNWAVTIVESKCGWWSVVYEVRLEFPDSAWSMNYTFFLCDANPKEIWNKVWSHKLFYTMTIVQYNDITNLVVKIQAHDRFDKLSNIITIKKSNNLHPFYSAKILPFNI